MNELKQRLEKMNEYCVTPLTDREKLIEACRVMADALEECSKMSVDEEKRQRHFGIFRDWKDISRQALAKATAILKGE